MTSDHPITNLSEADEEKRRASIELAKQSMRDQVARGHYPLSQISGPVLVTCSDSIDD